LRRSSIEPNAARVVTNKPWCGQCDTGAADRDERIRHVCQG
jgi:hypothetical protein